MAQKRKNLVFLITALLFAAQFIGNYGDYQIAAIPSSIYAAFHLTDMQFSSLITAPMLPCIFLSIVIGLLVDRFGIPKIVGIFFLLAALGFVLRCFAGNYPVMLIAMALSGFGCMVVNSNIAKLASALYPMDKVGTVVGILMAGSNAASALAFATTSMLPSLRVVFLIPTVASVVIFVLWALFARASVFTENQAGAAEEKTPVADSLKLCFKSRSLWLAGLTLFLILVNLFFPITGKEFDFVQKDIARRKGTEAGKASAEEKAALEKVTGFAYESLWKPENAGLKR